MIYVGKLRVTTPCYRTIVRKRNRQKLATRCVWEHVATASCAVVSKNIGSMITFPLETCRIYAQIGRQWTHVKELYKGYWTILTTQTIQGLCSYLAFFIILNVTMLTYQKPIHEAVVFASLCSSIVTSFVKVPLIFINRNIIFYQTGSGTDLLKNILNIFENLTPKVYRQCWLTIVISDIPETLIKTFLNCIVLYWNPSIDHLTRNSVVSLTTNIITAPFDYIITHAFCTVYKGQFNILNCYDGIMYKLVSCAIGQIVFFNLFNSLQPRKFY
jgi:uncharacterized PurR-regulated membrane protein YhhQ (DUF165 family)